MMHRFIITRYAGESCGAWGYNVDSETFVNELRMSKRLDQVTYVLARK